MISFLQRFISFYSSSAADLPTPVLLFLQMGLWFFASFCIFALFRIVLSLIRR